MVRVKGNQNSLVKLLRLAAAGGHYHPRLEDGKKKELEYIMKENIILFPLFLQRERSSIYLRTAGGGSSGESLHLLIGISPKKN